MWPKHQKQNMHRIVWESLWHFGPFFQGQLQLVHIPTFHELQLSNHDFLVVNMNLFLPNEDNLYV